MSKLRSHAIGLLTGAVGVLTVLAVLVAAGVLPTSETKEVVVTQGSPAAVSNASLTTGGALTPQLIYQKYSQGVVEIISTFTNAASQSQNPFAPSGSGGSQQALGSGFVVSKDGYILTNAHVVSNNGQTVKTVTVAFKGSGTQTTRVTGTVVGADNTSDVALIKVDPSKVGNLDTIPLGNSSTVQPGEPVVAIGNPMGYDFSITEGIVSATNRDLQSPNNSVIPNGIQTDAAINEGNSGGPLIDSSGNVIGINEQIASQSGGNQGLGFAVPINTALNVFNQLKTSGTVQYAFLGIQGQSLTDQAAQALGLKQTQGVLIAKVVPNSAAAKAGLKGGSGQKTIQGQPYTTGGDVITAIDGTQLTGMDQLAGIIAQHKPGDTVTLTVVSGSSTSSVTVTLDTKPAGL